MHIDHQNQPTETFRSLSDIRLRKEVLLNEIQNDDKRIKILWNDLFHAPKEMVSSTPSKRFSGLMSHRGRTLRWYHTRMETLSEVQEEIKQTTSSL